MGAGQYGLYSIAFERIFPAARLGQLKATGYKLFVDQFVHVPFVFFPMFYAIDGWIKSAEPLSGYVTQKWKHEINDTMLANWKLWLPAQTIGFGLIPAHLRVPYVAGVSFIWTSIFSMMQGRYQLEMNERDVASGVPALTNQGVVAASPQQVT
jgi:protein Mpv17